MVLDTEGFCRDGFTRIAAAVDTELVDACCSSIWTELAAHGMRRDDAATWVEPVARLRCRDDALLAAERSSVLLEAYDALVGPGRCLPPGNDGDVVPVRFPSERAPVDAGWHVEGNWKGPIEYHTDVWSTGRGLFVVLLLTDIGPDDAPMGMMPGSHLAAARVLEPYGTQGLGGAAVVDALQPTVMSRSPAHTTGRAGDAFVCHPFLAHTATWPHRGTEPRIAVVVKVEIVGGFALDGSDTSPVARTIVAGLRHRERD